MTDEKKTSDGSDPCSASSGPTASPEAASEQDRDCAKQRADETATRSDNAPRPIDFSTFIYSLATQALAMMGEARLPGMADIPQDLAAAKQTVDIIEMLSKKAEGNMTEAESKLISNLLYDLRIRYVQAAKRAKAE